MFFQLCFQILMLASGLAASLWFGISSPNQRAASSVEREVDCQSLLATSPLNDPLRLQQRTETKPGGGTGGRRGQKVPSPLSKPLAPSLYDLWDSCLEQSRPPRRRNKCTVCAAS